MPTVNLSSSRTVILCTIVALTGCDDGRDPGNETAMVEMPTFDEASLMQGRGVWMHTCRACHLMGIGGAPAVTDFAQWDVRLPKGSDTLVQNVIDGISDEAGEYRMPPRGGNSRLTDDQIRLAVGYKIAAIEALRGKRLRQSLSQRPYPSLRRPGPVLSQTSGNLLAESVKRRLSKTHFFAC